jgi:hypothetical protein
LVAAGFKIEKLEIMGRYFSVGGDNYKLFAQSLPRLLKFFLYIFVPCAEALALLDHCGCVKKNKILGGFHGGYFIVAEK